MNYFNTLFYNFTFFLFDDFLLFAKIFYFVLTKKSFYKSLKKKLNSAIGPRKIEDKGEMRLNNPPIFPKMLKIELTCLVY